MPTSRVKSKAQGNVTVEDRTKSSTVARVNSDGQVNVKFHSNPQQLAAWFERFEDAFKQCPEAKRKQRPKFKEEKPTVSIRLNIAIHIVGSRGDVQPFIPIAQLLSNPPFGHRVRICTHPIFKDFVESSGVEFFSIGGDPEALMAYMVKNPGLLPSRESLRAGDIGKRLKEMEEIMAGGWRSCIEAGDGMGKRIPAINVVSPKDLFIADAIIANPPSMAHIHCAEKLNIPLHMVFTMPWSPTKQFHHPLASMNYNDADPSVANYLSFMMMELLTWEGLGDVINSFRTNTLRLESISPLWGYRLIPRMRVPYSYLWSQSLIPKPPDWDDHIKITGFSFLPLASSYTPPSDLVSFLEKGPTPIYIGFGSIVVDNPQGLTDMLLEAIRLSGVRAIVSKGWGGVGSGKVPENIYLIGNCPHDWLFQRVSAVVHHGGAGTTAAGIALGRPTVVVPFFGDQPFWGQMIAQAGAGPVPVAFKKLTAEILAASIAFALKSEVQMAVQKMAQQISGEDGSRDTSDDVQDRLRIDDFRCDLFPNRLAVWRHTKTGAHLSGLAASCLIQRQFIQREHLRLVRRKHWYVDEGAEYPIVGVIASATGFIRGIASAVSAFDTRLNSPPPLKKSSQTAVLEKSPGMQSGSDRVSPGQLQELARRMAKKSLTKNMSPSLISDLVVECAAANDGNFLTPVRTHEPTGKPHSQVYKVARASGIFASDLVKTSCKAPVAFFYNIATGCHNLPAYAFWSSEVRRRDEITGFGSGLETAGKEFVLGFYDAFSGVFVLPYKGAKQEGGKGFGKGCFRAFRGLFLNISAAAWGLPGYTLKGVEVGLSRRQLSKIKAEVYLIRLRQSLQQYQEASEAERDEVVTRWKSLYP